jgi:hypothetical protein
MTEWRFFASTFEGGPWMRRVEGELKAFPFEIGTIPIWGRKWGPSLGTVDVTDPRYHQHFKANIYEIREEGGGLARFAATEFSNGVWGFYLPVDNNVTECK